MRSARRHRTKQKYRRWGYIVYPLIYVVAFQTIAEHIKCQGAIIGLSVARSDTLDNNGKMTNPCRSLSHLLSLVYFVGTLTLLQGGALYKMVSSVIHHRSLIASYCYKLMFWKNKCGEGRELEAGQWVLGSENQCQAVAEFTKFNVQATFVKIFTIGRFR